VYLVLAVLRTRALLAPFLLCISERVSNNPIPSSSIVSGPMNSTNPFSDWIEFALEISYPPSLSASTVELPLGQCSLELRSALGSGRPKSIHIPTSFRNSVVLEGFSTSIIFNARLKVSGHWAET
jgi:hypothetical protein